MHNKNLLPLLCGIVLTTITIQKSYCQIDISFKSFTSQSASFSSVSIDTAKGTATLSPSSFIVIHSVVNPDKMIVDYSTTTANGATIQLSKVESSGDQKINTYLLPQSSEINPSDKLMLNIPETITLKLQLVSTDPNEKILIKNIKIYSMSAKETETIVFKKRLAEIVKTGSIQDYNSQIDSMKRLTLTSLYNIYDVYNKQNHLLVELRVADFMNARNSMSNPVSYDKFREMIKNMKTSSTDSAVNTLLNNWNAKLEPKANKFQNTLSSLINVGSAVLNGFTGGAAQGIFNGIKTVATTIINSRQKLSYNTQGEVVDCVDISKTDFRRKYNDRFKDFKVLNVMLDKLEGDKLKIDFKINKIKEAATIIEKQQARLLEFASIYHTGVLRIPFDKNSFIEKSKLAHSDLVNNLNAQTAKIVTYIEQQKTNANDPQFESKKEKIRELVEGNTEALSFNSIYYDNSKEIFGFFLDFADDLQDEELINREEAIGLDANYVTQVNAQYKRQRDNTIQHYCDLMKDVKNTLISPSNLREKSAAANRLCPNLFTIDVASRN
jgi:hypothetical protein